MAAILRLLAKRQKTPLTVERCAQQIQDYFRNGACAEQEAQKMFWTRFKMWEKFARSKGEPEELIAEAHRNMDQAWDEFFEPKPVEDAFAGLDDEDAFAGLEEGE